MKTLIVLLCLVVAVPAWCCAILNAGDHSELGGECTQSDLNALLNAFQKQLGSSDSMPQPLEMHYKLIPEPKPKPKFFRVFNEDGEILYIQRDKITAYRIEIDYFINGLSIDKCKGKDMIVAYKTMYRDGLPMVCREKKNVVEGQYLEEWYTLYVGKTKQDAINWLDRNGQ